MNTETWALIVFTILAQASVGAFIVLGVVHFFASRKAGVEQADMLSDRALFAVGGFLVLGMLASLLHLGQPQAAYRAITNFGSSWLSREIAFGVAFAVLGAIFTVLQWQKWGSATLRQVVALLAGLVGIALVYSMARVYMTKAQIAWNTVATPISFFVTTLLLGSLVLAGAFVVNYWLVRRKEDADCQQQQCDLLRGVIKWIAILAIVMLGIEMVVSALNSAHLVSIQESGQMDFLGEYGVLFAIRLALAFIGAGVFGLLMYQTASSPGRENAMATFALSALAVVFAAEILGRFLFYATGINVGL